MNDFRMKFEVACERYLSYHGTHNNLTQGCVLRSEKDPLNAFKHPSARNYIYLQFGNMKELDEFIEDAKKVLQKWVEK